MVDYVLCLDCGDGSTGVDIFQNLSPMYIEYIILDVPHGIFFKWKIFLAHKGNVKEV